MIWKIVAALIISVFIFVLGLWLGSLQAEWSKPENTSAVAYLSMVGGWVSGIATSLAVIISLYATYQASQSNVEKIQIKLESIPARIFEDELTKISIKNMRPIAVHILKIFIAVDGSKKSADISFVRRGADPMPYALYQLGEKWEFAFNIYYNAQWISIFTTLESGGQPSFKKGFFIIESAMKQYRIEMSDHVLGSIRSKYEAFKEERSTPQ